MAWHGLVFCSPQIPMLLAARVMACLFRIISPNTSSRWFGTADEGEPGSGLTTAFNSRRRRTIHPQLFWLDISHPSILLYAHVQLTETPRETLSLTMSLTSIETQTTQARLTYPQKKKERAPHVSHQLTLVNLVSTPPSLGRDVTPAVSFPLSSLPEPLVKVRDSQYAIETKLSETGRCFAFTLHPSISLRPLS